MKSANTPRFFVFNLERCIHRVSGSLGDQYQSGIASRAAASLRKRIVGCFRSQLLDIALPQPSFLCRNEKYVINRCHPNDMLCSSKTMPRIIDAKRISPMKIVI